MKIFKKVLMYIWQLPQNLIGLILYHIYGKWWIMETTYMGKKVLYSGKMRGGISLGNYIIIQNILDNPREILWHEYGHCRQSEYLGWLYLLVIGIPSILWAFLHDFKPFSKYNYYSFYTEKWADKLGGVTR